MSTRNFDFLNDVNIIIRKIGVIQTCVELLYYIYVYVCIFFCKPFILTKNKLFFE